MLKKLQIKISLILIISIMTVIIFTLAIFSYINISTYISSTKEIMEREVYFFINEYSYTRDKKPRFEELAPEMGFEKEIHKDYLYLAIDDLGNISKEQNNLATEDISKYESLAKEIVQKKDKFDIYYKNIKYFKLNWQDYTYIVLSPSRQYLEYCLRLAMIFMDIFIMILVLVSFISRYLSYIVVKPVKKAWEEQERFVADASHELRTPLSIILANLKILLKNNEKEEQKKWLDISILEATRMQKLIENLLFLAKSDASILVYKIEELDFSEILSESFLGFEVLAFEKNIDFRYKLEEKCIVKADKDSLKQIIGILVDNAFKYCGEEKKVFASLYKNAGKVVFSIENTGKAIEKENLDKIFERFYRLDKQRSRSEGGYGLGLSIAYVLAGQLGAKLYAKEREEGNEFILEL